MKIVILAITASILFGCLLEMPYGYYQFVRVSCCAAFAWLAYQENKAKHFIIMLICIGIAILFNPISKISFSRTLWNQIDIALGSALTLWAIIEIIIAAKRTKNT